MRIIDISRPIHDGMPVYPGNPAVSIQTVRTKTSILSKITFGSHTGTHIDAPRHVFAKGVGVDGFALNVFFGPCRVLDMTKIHGDVQVSDFLKHKIKKGERILVRTKNSLRTFQKFYGDYVALSGDAAVYLAKVGIRLFGIDYLSVKKRGSLDNRPHTVLLRKKIAIFEGLDLSKAKQGTYTFVGFPLKFGSIEGSPARAVLIAR